MSKSHVSTATPQAIAQPSAVPTHLAIRKMRDASRRVVAAIVVGRASPAGTSTADVVARDIEALRWAANIAKDAQGVQALVATSSATVRLLDPGFARVLKSCATGLSNLGVLIRCPVEVEEATAALHFAALCASQGAQLALELPENLCAQSWATACSMAGAIDAAVVIVTGRTIVKLYEGRGARGAREMVARLARPGATLAATAIDGPAVQALCERAGANVFEFAGNLSAMSPSSFAPIGRPRASKKITFVNPRRGSTASLGLLAAGVLSVAACSSVPKPAVPDGTSRVSVNDPDRIAMLQRQAQLETSVLAQRDAQRTEVSELRSQVQQLRTAVKLLAVAPPPEVAHVSATGAPAVATFTAAGQAPLGSAIPLAANSDSRAVEATREGLIFRVFHPTGGANFAPAGKFAEALHAAATSSASIEIRGFTDSPVDDAANRRVASARSTDARQWLIDQGVDPQLIKSRSTSHGQFLGDNSTPAGRGLNRRVEIEIHGDTTQAVAILNRKEG